MNELARITTDEIYENWDIGSWVKDPEVESDIKSALVEAFARGCAAGGMDGDVFRQALDYCRED